MPAVADVEKSLREAQQRELLLLRSLSGLLLKWREIVKGAQLSPVVAEHLFGTLLNSGGLHGSFMQEGEIEALLAPPPQQQQQQRQMLEVLTARKPLTENARPLVDNGMAPHAPVMDNPMHGGSSSSLSGSPASRPLCTISPSTTMRLEELIPPIGWIHELLARRTIIPNGTTLRSAPPPPQQEQLKIVNIEEGAIDVALLGEILDSVRVAFAGMNALQTSVARHSETGVNTGVGTVETVAQSGVRSGPADSGVANKAMLTEWVMFFESGHRQLLEIMMQFHGSLLRRVGYMMKDVLHELQGVKRGLRDSVELCAIHKNHIRRLSTELYGEEQMRMLSPCRALGLSPLQRVNSHGARNSCRGADPYRSASSRHSSPGISRPSQRERQCLLGELQLKQWGTGAHGNGSWSSNVADERTGVYLVGTRDDRDDFDAMGGVSNVPISDTVNSSCSALLELPPQRGFMCSAERERRRVMVKKIEIPRSFCGSGSGAEEEHRGVSPASQLPEAVRSRGTSSPSPRRKSLQYRRQCAYVVPRFGFIVEAADGPPSSHLNLRVVEVESGSPARESGLAVGDVVVEVVDEDASMSVTTWDCFLAWLLLRTPNSLRVNVISGRGNRPRVSIIMRVGSGPQDGSGGEDERRDSSTRQKHREAHTTVTTTTTTTTTTTGRISSSSSSSSNSNNSSSSSTSSSSSSNASCICSRSFVHQLCVRNVRPSSAYLDTGSRVGTQAAESITPRTPLTSCATETTARSRSTSTSVRKGKPPLRVSDRAIRWNGGQPPLIGQSRRFALAAAVATRGFDSPSSTDVCTVTPEQHPPSSSPYAR